MARGWRLSWPWLRSSRGDSAGPGRREPGSGCRSPGGSRSPMAARSSLASRSPAPASWFGSQSKRPRRQRTPTRRRPMACRNSGSRPGPGCGEGHGVPEAVASTRALVIEDDPNIVDLIRSNLAVRGFDTVVSTDGARALQLLDTETPDIVLLDLMLPEIDGFELCRQMRERSGVAIIVVSARGGERDKVTALNMGADDYMTKPFSIEELLARIAATLRRTRPAVPSDDVPQLIDIGALRIDLASEQVFRRGERVHLTPTEFALLRELATNRGKLLTHAHLLRRVWGHGYETETEYVRVYVRRLRAKLEDDGGAPLILTQPRAGYRFAPDEACQANAGNPLPAR